MNPQHASATIAAPETAGARVNASLLAICQAMGERLELREVLPTILTLALQEMRAQQGSVLLHNKQLDKLEMLAAIGLPEEIVRKGYIPRKGSIAEWVIDNDQPLLLNSHARGEDYHALDDTRPIHSSMCLPLRAGGQVIGTLNINRTASEPGPFSEAELETMLVLASQAAQCIQISRLHEANLRGERLAAIGQTVAGLSHCIKNIMTGVRGGMSLIEMAACAEDWRLVSQGKDILHRNLERLSAIMLDMLDYSKEREPRKGRVDVLTMFEDVAMTVRSEAEMRQIAMELRVADEQLKAKCDNQQIFRCLLNLAHNALDATPADGKVWMSAARTVEPAVLRRMKDKSAEAAVVLRVGDSGPGIAAEHRPVIFDPFFSTKGSRGTGLGLAVTRKIIEEHGGYIEVESAPDQPAVFAIYLPD